MAPGDSCNESLLTIDLEFSFAVKHSTTCEDVQLEEACSNRAPLPIQQSNGGVSEGERARQGNKQVELCGRKEVIPSHGQCIKMLGSLLDVLSIHRLRVLEQFIMGCTCCKTSFHIPLAPLCNFPPC
jgi:hypothetical protein